MSADDIESSTRTAAASGAATKAVPEEDLVPAADLMPNSSKFAYPVFRYSGRMHYVALAQVLILLSLANGSPVMAKRIFGETFAAPVDANARFVDGQPLVGPAKTIRGIVISLLVTALGAMLLGLQFWLGLLVASTAMAGDLLSSFLKRRLHLAPSSKVTGLDQIPESLFPLLACGSVLSLTVIDIAVGCAVFFAGQVLLSRLFFWLRLRDRPY